MLKTKRGRVSILGIASAVFGIWLRLKARDLAWPTYYDYSGPREATKWAITERAYVDISLIFLAFGLAVLLLVVAHWLWTPAAARQDQTADT